MPNPGSVTALPGNADQGPALMGLTEVLAGAQMASGAEVTASSGGAQCSGFLPHWQLVIRRGWRLEAGGWRLEAGGWRLEAGCFKDST